MHSKSREFTGTGTALITPFKRDGTIDEVRVTEAEAKNDKGSNEYNKRNTES